MARWAGVGVVKLAVSDGFLCHVRFRSNASDTMYYHVAISAPLRDHTV